MRFCNIIKLVERPLFVVPCRHLATGFKVVQYDSRGTNYEKNYFKYLMNDSVKYPACAFTGDPAVFAENTSNGLVAALRDLAREEGCEVKNAKDIQAIENFTSDSFTLEDLIEIFYWFSIPEVSARVPYDVKDIRKLIGDKCWADPPRRVRNDPRQHLILLHLLKKTPIHCPGLIFYVVDSLYKRFKVLSPTQIVEFFYFWHYRKIPHRETTTKFSFEGHVAAKLCDMSLDEVAVIAYGIFRNEYHPYNILSNALSKRIEDEVENWTDVQSSAFSKFLRFCTNCNKDGSVGRIMEKCMPLTERLALIPSIHVGCIGVTHNIECPELIKRLMERTIQELSAIRLKDIERLLLATLYSKIHLTKDSEFVTAVVDNLECRKDEIKNHPSSYWSLLQYFIMHNIYLEDHISFALSDDIMEFAKASGWRKKMHEVLYIDVSTEIERPCYKGNKLSESLRRKLTGRYLAIVESAKTGAIYRSVKVVTWMLEQMYGQTKCTMKRLLPHHISYHPVICFNKNNEAQDLEEKLEKPTGTVLWAPDDCNQWLCFVLVRSSLSRSYGTSPVVIEAKLRQLKTIGYTPIVVNIYEFVDKSEDLKKNYLREVIERALLKSESDSRDSRIV